MTRNTSSCWPNRTGRHGTFEVPTRHDDPWRSTDVGIRDAPARTRILAECWNTFGDLAERRGHGP
jgi:hypothetical protein